MELIKQWGLVLLLSLVGVGLIGYGVWEQVGPREVVVEIIKDKNLTGETSDKEDGGEIVVDVAGAVEKPGIYKLSSNSRIGDAVVKAGGLAANADREWVASTLNLAEKVEDGVKIYIPNKGMVQADPVSQTNQRSVNIKNQKLNINTASVTELDKLEGIGEARANSIVSNRPYAKTEELVTIAKLPQSVYDKIKDSISVY